MRPRASRAPLRHGDGDARVWHWGGPEREQGGREQVAGSCLQQVERSWQPSAMLPRPTLALGTAAVALQGQKAGGAHATPRMAEAQRQLVVPARA